MNTAMTMMKRETKQASHQVDLAKAAIQEAKDTKKNLQELKDVKEIITGEIL